MLTSAHTEVGQYPSAGLIAWFKILW